MKIIDYGLYSVSTDDTDDPCGFLTEMVARTVADGEGWQPHGPLVTYTDATGAAVLVQPMAKYEPSAAEQRP